MIDSEITKKALADDERKIIRSIYRLPTTKAGDIMIPRVDMVAFEANDQFENLKSLIEDSGYSKIPVFKKNIDNIIGVVYAKDVLLKPEKNDIEALMKVPFTIPENMKINKLLMKFKAQKIHIAIVVDEYGGTSGLVTMEDILEELVGEIQDEYDEELPDITKVSDSEYKVNGMCDIHEFNEALSTKINSEEYENLAAFLLDEFNRMPGENDELTYQDLLKFTIEEIIDNRLNSISVKVLNK